jgi:MFS family permease
MPLSGIQTSRERASGTAERHHWPGMRAAAEYCRRTAPPRAAAFWLAAGVLCLLFFAAGTPSPLYGIYRAQLRFSATTLTAVFAIYAVVLLLTLLVFGSVSDYLGRRRVILAALTVTAGACVVFLAAHSVGMLFAARVLQGVAVGAATGALGAALIDLQPEGSGLAPLITTAAPLLGLGAGALGSSALAQYGPAPTRLVWWLLLGTSVAAAAGILAIPEPGTRRSGAPASLRPQVGVPRQARGTFATAVPCLIAVWALSGLYQSLGPSLAAQITGSADLLWGGLMVFLLTGVAAAATVAFHGVTPRTAMLSGCLALLAGVAVTFAAIATTAAAAFLVGTAVAGVGTGLALLGVNRSLIALAPPGQRARLIAAIFIISFLGLSIPALIAGVATAHFGLHRTALAYCLAIAALVAVAAGSLMLRRTGPGHRSRGLARSALARPRASRAPGPGESTVPAAARWLEGEGVTQAGRRFGVFGVPVERAPTIVGFGVPAAPASTGRGECGQARRNRAPALPEAILVSV